MSNEILGISKRHFRRLVKAEIGHYSEENISVADIVSEEDDNIESVDIVEEIKETEAEGNEFHKELPKTLSEKLFLWAISHKISRNAVDDLLKILIAEGSEVPSCAKTLLRTKVHELDVCEIPPGEYFHIGLKKAINILDLEIPHTVSELALDIFVDGLPLYKSSSKTLWPILGYIVDNVKAPPFLIGTYIGPSKPQDVKLYIKKFVDEFVQIQNEGVMIKGRVINIKIRLFTCDAPARAFLTGTVGHTSAHGCSKCQQVGKK